MSKENTRLTSVKVLSHLYDHFKINTVNNGMTLQKFTNRCIHLYLNDTEFKETIEQTDDLLVSGSNL
tara:strand:+ start:110 stop:310 length:201 start_codon:yes stop_codon:yes gene_type:complete